MSQATPDYTLTANDMNAFVALLQAEGALGPARTAPAQAQFWDFFGAIDTIVYSYYPYLANAQVKGWIDSLFPPLLSTKTCYGIDAAGMYVLYSYYQFNTVCVSEEDPYYPNDTCRIHAYPPNTPTGREPTWDNSKGLPNSAPWNWFATAVGLWYPPAAPDSFFNALMNDVNLLNDALHTAGHNTSTVALLVGWNGASPDLAAVQQFEQSRFDPANWTDAGTFVQNLWATNLWQGQHDAMAALLQPDTLTADAYFFLLHLLVALPTGDARSQQLAQRIASASATSPEYPNDTFANQLVYLALMYLADPGGSFAWTNAQLQAELALLSGLVAGADPASQALQASLARHQRVLRTDTAYPMQDPYCPSVGFNQRKTDTMFALDKARAGLNQ